MDEAAKPGLPETRPGGGGEGHPNRPRRPRPRPPYLTEVADNSVEGSAPLPASVLPTLEAGDSNNINNRINDDRGPSVDGPGFDLKDENGKVTEKLHLGEFLGSRNEGRHNCSTQVSYSEVGKRGR